MTPTSQRAPRQVRFDLDDVDIVTYPVPKRQLRPWSQAPNEGALLDIPDHLPADWWARSADTLRLCQLAAQEWRDAIEPWTRLTDEPELDSTF